VLPQSTPSGNGSSNALIPAARDQPHAITVAIDAEEVAVVWSQSGPFKSRQKSLGPSGLLAAADLTAQGA
jgi:hypothetical protein